MTQSEEESILASRRQELFREETEAIEKDLKNAVLMLAQTTQAFTKKINEFFAVQTSQNSKIDDNNAKLDAILEALNISGTAN